MVGNVDLFDVNNKLYCVNSSMVIRLIDGRGNVHVDCSINTEA